MIHLPNSERAVSEVLGAVILIGIIATVLALAGVMVFSQPLPQKMPALNVRIWNDTSKIYIRHDGGDSLRAAELQIKVGGTVPVFNLTTAPTVPWETLSIGDTLQTPMLSSSQFPSVQIIYTGYGSSSIVLASYGLVDTSVGTITTTTTPTTTPTTPPSAPTFTSLTPNIGPIAGGTDLHIFGTGFTGASSLTFDGIAATTFTVTSDILIIAVTPAHAAGAVNVTITTPGGIATGTGAYTYGSAPAFVSIVPSSGLISGGTGVTITGTNLIGTTAVTFGGTSATGFSVVNSTSITATTPGHAAGLVDVVVTTPNGTATGPNAFTYTAAPTVSSVAPATGPTAGGTSVTIIGTNLIGASAATFGGSAATSVSFVNATAVTAITPAHGAGLVDVVVTTPNGTATGTGVYTYANTRVQIYYEGFESGTGGWSFTGDNSRRTDAVPKNQTADIRLRNTGSMTRTISTSGYMDIVVQFAWVAQSLDTSSEYVRGEYSTDGINWNTLSQITGPTASPTTLTIVTSSVLPASANNNTNFRLRFRIAGNNNQDLLYVDDVKVTGIPI